jgi:MmyB-like transcription regulator ligand binding domain
VFASLTTLATPLVAALTEASPQFRDWWAQYPVRYFRPARIGLTHPQAGRITLELFQLRLEDDPGLLMVVQVPADPVSPDRVTALSPGTHARAPSGRHRGPAREASGRPVSPALVPGTPAGPSSRSR